MKAKHVFWIFAGIAAIIASAVGVAVVLDRYLSRKECTDGYIVCDDDNLEVSDQ